MSDLKGKIVECKYEDESICMAMRPDVRQGPMEKKGICFFFCIKKEKKHILNLSHFILIQSTMGLPTIVWMANCLLILC